MEFKIRPAAGNAYPIAALFIRSSSPAVWLEEATGLGLDLQRVPAYAVPGDKANVLLGCIFIVEQKEFSLDTGNCQQLQLVAQRLLIPEYSQYHPELHATEWDKYFPEGYYFLHPETGMVKLEETIDWGSVLHIKPEKKTSIKVVADSIHIPAQINAFIVSLDDEDLRKELFEPKTDQEILDNLPFDLKKLMNGNQKEMEKYLKFLKEHPDKAIALGIPLDTLGSSRNNQWGSYTFDGGWGGLGFDFSFLSNLFSGGSGGSGPTGASQRRPLMPVWVTLVALIAILWLLLGQGARHSSSYKDNLSAIELRSGKTRPLDPRQRDSLKRLLRQAQAAVAASADSQKHVETGTQMSAEVPVKEERPEVATSQNPYETIKVADSILKDARYNYEAPQLPEVLVKPDFASWNLGDVLGLLIALLGGILLLRLLFGRSGGTGSRIWDKIDTGTGTPARKLIYFLLLLLLLLFIFYPLLHRYGFNWLSMVVMALVALMLLGLFNPSDKVLK